VISQNATTRSTDLMSVAAVRPGHILLVEDDALIRGLVTMVLEDEGYAVTASVTPMEATRLLDQMSFDLVITDGFSRVPGTAFANMADLIRGAGVTPVALFSAHTLDLELAKAAGFRDIITKPFDLDTLVRQVTMLLGDRPGCGTPDPPQGEVIWPLATGPAYSEPARNSQEPSLQAAGG
jgi:DNA-binding response OmpR family regulator